MNRLSKRTEKQILNIIALVIVLIFIITCIAACGSSTGGAVLPLQNSKVTTTTADITTATLEADQDKDSENSTEDETAATTNPVGAETNQQQETTAKIPDDPESVEDSSEDEYVLPPELNPKGKPTIDKDGNLLVPVFSLTDRDGNEVSLADFEGKVVVLNFWASWCPPCKEEMPAFQEMNQEFEQADDVVILSVNLTDGQRETREKAIKYLDDNGFTFKTLFDENNDVGYLFGIQSIPVTMIMDRDGYLRDYVMGSTTKDRVMESVNAIK